MSMNGVDLAILGVIFLSMLTGFVRGFFKELIALAVWILAFWLAYRYTAVVEAHFQSFIHDGSVRKIAAFVIILLGTIISGGLVNGLIGFILKRAGLSGTDRLLGAGFGFVRGLFVVSMLIVVLNMTSIPHDEYFRHSTLFTRFEPLVKWISAQVPDVIHQVKWLDHGEEPKVMDT